MKPLHEMTPEEARAVGAMRGPGRARPRCGQLQRPHAGRADGGEFAVRVLAPEGPVGS